MAGCRNSWHRIREKARTEGGRVLLFPEQTAVARDRAIRAAQRQAADGRAEGRGGAVAFHRQKPLPADDHHTGLLQILGVENLALDADDRPIKLPFVVLLFPGGHQDTEDVFQLLHRDRGQGSHGIAGGQLHTHPDGGQNQIDILVGEGTALVVQHQVRPAGAQQGEEFFVVAVQQPDRNGRIPGRKRLQRPADLGIVLIAGQADLQKGILPAGDAGGLPAHLVVIGHQNQTFPVKVFPGRGQHKFPVLSLQQGKPQFPFQRFDLLRYGRLGDMALFRRFGKAVVAHHGLKIANLPQQKPTSCHNAFLSVYHGWQADGCRMPPRRPNGGKFSRFCPGKSCMQRQNTVKYGKMIGKQSSDDFTFRPTGGLNTGVWPWQH